MTPRKKRAAVIACMLVTVCGGPWGCAIRTHPGPRPPSDEARAQFKTVGVPAARDLPESQLQAPTSGKGWGAAKGAGYGLAAGATPGLAIASVITGCRGGGPAALVCGAILVLGLGVAAAGGTVGALGGTVYGALAAESASRIGAAETELGLAFADLDVQQTIRDHVLRTARERSSLSFVALEDHATEPTDYRALAMRGVDTVLEVEVSSIRLDGQGINPPVRLLMTASARLIRTADGVELYAERFAYRSPNEHKFMEWAAGEGQVLREEVDRGAEALASDIVQLLFQPDSARETGDAELPTPGPSSFSTRTQPMGA